jgi:hypothetical protein
MRWQPPALKLPQRATAGALIKLLGAPLALIADAALLISSAMILRGIKVTENRPVAKDAAFWRDLKAGIHFVAKNPCYWRCRNRRRLAALLQRRLSRADFVCDPHPRFVRANRRSELHGHGLGHHPCQCLWLSHQPRDRLGPCMVLGITICGAGWSLLAIAPVNHWGMRHSLLMLMCFSVGAVLIFINFLALRQAPLSLCWGA